MDITARAAGFVATVKAHSKAALGRLAAKLEG